MIEQVAPGSAIVGTELDPDSWRVYYEGNTVGASNIVTLADRAYHAAGRIEPDGEDGARAIADWLGREGWFPASVAIEDELVRSK